MSIGVGIVCIIIAVFDLVYTMGAFIGGAVFSFIFAICAFCAN